MDFCDKITANIMMPIGAMLTCLFVGWYIPKRTVYAEFTNRGMTNQRWFMIYLFAVRYICPICILIIFLHQMGVV